MRVGSPSFEWVLVAANVALVVCLGVAYATQDPATSEATGTVPARLDRPPVLIVVAAASRADVAVGRPAAETLDGEVLAVPGSGLTSAMIEDLAAATSPERVLILGGPAAVSEATARQVADATGAPVSRVAGADRFGTAAALASSQFDAPVERLRVMSGDELGVPAPMPDQQVTDTPLLLVETGRIPAPVAAALRQLRPRSIEVSGGPDAVSDAVLQQLQDYTTGRVVRLSGEL